MYIKVKVIVGARGEDFVKVKDDTFAIKVKEPAKNNMANKRVLELVASHFGVPVGHVKIVNGHHSPTKLLSIREDLF